jgi:rRNA small subunit pseudouridine methyltransferase Nep1
MLNLILVDSEIELVPREIANHPAVRINATKEKKPASQIILDSALHHSAMRRLPQADAGRPDIVHFFLLLSLGSLLNTGVLRTSSCIPETMS